MARWKLIEAHYLNVPGTTWEAKEVDRSTGRQVKKVFNVPLYLDPKDEADWNYRREQDPDLQDGGIIVCLAGKGRPRDIVFEGDPTPCMIPLDDEGRPTWLFGQTVHEGCDRGGYYEQAQFAEEYGSPTCIVKLGCWGPVVQCNVGKRGWMGGVGGCPNVGGICIGCTMPGFPDKFMPFMNQPPGSLLSSSAVMTYGRAIQALRRFTQASLNREPPWRSHRKE